MSLAQRLSPAARAVGKRQMAVVALIVGGIAAIAAGVNYLYRHEQPPPPAPKAVPTDIATSAKDLDVAKSWRIREAARIDALSTELKDMRTRLEAAQQANADFRKQVETRDKPANPAAALPPPPPLPAPPRPLTLPPPPPIKAAGAGAAGAAAVPTAPPPPRIVSVDLEADGATLVPGQAQRLPGAARAAAPAGALHRTAAAAPRTGTAPGSSANPEPAEYLPTSSFVTAHNLNGALAPTGGAAQKSPVPMVFRLTDHAVLPNHVRGRIKDCFVQAAAHGQLGAERVHVRLTRFSCIETSGRAIDLDVKGYVVGEDGLEGMGGTVVTKQGQTIANALLAGVASGIGQGFQLSYTESSVSPLGRVDTTQQNKELQYGLAKGVSTALERLAKYYLDLADQMHPVIEIGALRKVTLVFSRGFSLEPEQTQ